MPESVKVEGLKEFRAGLKRAEDPKAVKAQFRREELAIAREVATGASAIASSMGGPFAHFAGDFKGAATVKGASVRIMPEANATFWGAKKNTGWNAPHVGGLPQHPTWIGAAWDAGGPGGPYALNPAITAAAPHIVDQYGKAMDRVTHPAFPN